MTSRKRVLALLFCVGFVLSLVISSAFIALQARHYCCREDCPVCQIIALHVSLLRILGLAMLISPSLSALCQNYFQRFGQRLICPSASGTLVSWKIRLND